MNEEYYVLENGEKTGPFTFNELTERGLDVDTSVSTPGSDTWQNASYLPEFNEYFEKQGHYFPTEDNIAHFGWRTLAFIIDYMIISLVAGTIDIKAGWLVLPATAKFDPAALMNAIPERSLVIIEISFVLLFLLYNVLLEASNARASFGKKLCGLKVVDADGRKLTFIMALLRNIGAVTAYNIFALFFLIISFFCGRPKANLVRTPGQNVYNQKRLTGR